MMTAGLPCVPAARSDGAACAWIGRHTPQNRSQLGDVRLQPLMATVDGDLRRSILRHFDKRRVETRKLFPSCMKSSFPEPRVPIVGSPDTMASMYGRPNAPIVHDHVFRLDPSIRNSC